MKSTHKFVIALATVVALGTGHPQAQVDYTKYVDPFIGTTEGGNTIPGPTLPLGMVKVGPDCGKKNWNGGWDETGNIHGFSHIHGSGLGGGCKYGNVLFAPIVGDLTLADYSSPRDNERAEVGEYAVGLTRYNIRARLSAMHKSAIHEYTFPASDESKVIVDLGSCLNSDWKGMYEEENQHIVGSEVRILSDREMEGYTRVRGGWNIGTAYTVYFYALFDTPAKEFGTWKSGKLYPGTNAQPDTNEKSGAYFSFNTSEGQKIKVKVGISYLGVGRAKANLAEMQTWELNEVKQHCVDQWNKLLGKVSIKGSDYQKKLFYTALYHSYMQPTDKTGENSRWESDAPYYDDFFAIWDTFRATHPFFTLLTPSLQVDILNSLLDIYRHEGWMSDARSGDFNGRVQGGSNVDILFSDAFVKGLSGVDYTLALKSMIQNAEVFPGGNEQAVGRGGLADYNTKGYVSTKYERSGSRTMEYGNCDLAVATLAKALGHDSLADKYQHRALHNWKNLWNPDIESLGFKGFIWPKDETGQWLPEDKFSVMQGGSWPDVFYETFSWELSMYVPQDMKGLMEICGGPDMLTKRLDTYFTHEKGKNKWSIGLYQVANEPSFLMPCLYNYTGRPDKTAEIVREVLRTKYNDTKAGITGNDDSGSMSSWYLFHALGFFPNAGQDIYLISSPTFEEVSLALENGNTLKIVAKGASEKNIYVQSATLNGTPLKVSYFKHSDIAQGGTLEFVMGNKPSKWAQTPIYQ